jgi:putative ABC transport system permease protein
MWRFAWRNLLTRPLRTVLALVGLSIPILGVIGLFSLSGAMRQLVGDTLSRIQGIIVVREGALTPVLSNLKADLEPKLRALPGVVAVAAEVWEVAPAVEGRSAVGRVARSVVSGVFKPGGNANQVQSLLDQPVITGQDIPGHQKLKSAVFPRALLKGPQGGRFLQPGDEGTRRVVISSKIARENPQKDPTTGSERPKQVGDQIDIGGQAFDIIGLYETGSLFLDTIIIMDINTARELLQVSRDTVSSFYIEGASPERNEELTAFIEQQISGIDARSPNEIMNNFGGLLNQLDMFLLATVMLALLVGVIGIVNTMLMSTTERFSEFGVLRTNGWSRGNLLALVSTESAYLGLLAGLVGFLLAWLFTVIANQFLTSTGLSLSISLENAVRGILLAVVMGTVGGLYPAWKASRMVPMAAIRLGSR